MCEMHIQLCVISVELETNTRMILILLSGVVLSEKRIGPRIKLGGTLYNNFLASDKIDPILMH